MDHFPSAIKNYTRNSIILTKIFRNVSCHHNATVSITRTGVHQLEITLRQMETGLKGNIIKEKTGLELIVLNPGLHL